jgi:hypothetical protein
MATSAHAGQASVAPRPTLPLCARRRTLACLVHPSSQVFNPLFTTFALLRNRYLPHQASCTLHNTPVMEPCGLLFSTSPLCRMSVNDTVSSLAIFARSNQTLRRRRRHEVLHQGRESSRLFHQERSQGVIPQGNEGPKDDEETLTGYPHPAIAFWSGVRLACVLAPDTPLTRLRADRQTALARRAVS